MAEAQFKKEIEATVAALRSGDLEEIGKHYHPDITIQTSLHKTTGKDNVLAYLKELREKHAIDKMTVNVEEVSVGPCGTRAYVRYTQDRQTAKGTFQGRGLAIMVKEADKFQIKEITMAMVLTAEQVAKLHG